jgi:NAD(P)-dependent dehydrogenase (short-subunit alcohol dehydrogenase family)
MADHSIKGKTVLIAGGAKNLGGLIARDLAQQGAKAVVVHYNSEGSKAEADATVTAIKAAGALAVAIQADLTTAAAVEKLFADAIGAVGKPDIAINTVGKVLKKPMAEISEVEYDEMTAVNSKTAFFFLKEAGKNLNDNGKICTVVTSLLGAFTPFYAAYAGTKAPVEHYTRAASKEFGARGISVTAVGPGPMDTPFFYPAEGATLVVQQDRSDRHSRCSAVHPSLGERRLVDHRSDYPDQRWLHYKVIILVLVERRLRRRSTTVVLFHGYTNVSIRPKN